MTCPTRVPAMRVDVVSIFPDYLAPLDLSLIGKAREDGLLDVRVHDLRDFTHDRHRTVDDTPYGGGAGMVMKPQPWSEALDHVLAQGNPSGAKPRLIVPGPGGQPFTQALARELAHEPWLAFACGRYEGIDERVYDHAREDLGLEVSVVSLGDYVLNGGEVAVLAMVEAVGRLVPGVIGNAESLVEESHEDGLLEYPIYTKPGVVERSRGPRRAPLGQPRRHRRRGATSSASRAPRRADPTCSTPRTRADGGDVEIAAATPGDVPELAVLMRACWVQEAARQRHPRRSRPCTRASTTSARASTRRRPGSPAAAAGSSARCAPSRRGDDWFIGRLCVAPDLQGRGLGRRLLEHAESTRAGRHTHVHAPHRRAQRRQPADVQEGGLPPRRRARARSRARSRSSSAAALTSVVLTRRGRRRGRRAAAGAGGSAPPAPRR